MAPRLTIVEVSPRDGLQIEPVQVPTGTTIVLAATLACADLKRIGVTHLVHLKMVPQSTDAEAVLEDLARALHGPCIEQVRRRASNDRRCGRP